MSASKGGKSSVIERIKAEISAQQEGQDEVIEFSFQDMDIGKFTPEIAALFKKYPKLSRKIQSMILLLVSLEFSNCKLTSLDNFPNIKGLIKLCLEENQLTGKDINYIGENFTQIQFLSLTNNKIAEFQELEGLKNLKELQQLDLQENKICQKKDYREKLFEICQKLEVLDNKDKEGNEVEYSDEDDGEDGDDDLDDDGELEDMTEDDEYDDDDEDEEPQVRKMNKK